MKKETAILLVTLTLFCWVGGTQAFADIQKMKSYGNEYITGGVGFDEREAMEAMAEEYNMKAVFALASGNFIADIAVTITKPTGEKVLETVSTGPWLYVKLPPGAYSVKALYKGTEKIRTINVGQTLKVFLFHWKL